MACASWRWTLARVNCSQFGLERLAQQRVREPERAGVALSDNAGDERGIEIVERGVDVAVAHARDKVDVELAATDRRDLQQRLA